MRGYNIIVIKSKISGRYLMCFKKKGIFPNCYNFVGGKIEENENGIDAAYRELYEETNIYRQETNLQHIMDLVFQDKNYKLEVYYGEVDSSINLQQEDEPLYWFSYFDIVNSSNLAGDGNIPYILKYIKKYNEERIKMNIGSYYNVRHVHKGLLKSNVKLIAIIGSNQALTENEVLKYYFDNDVEAMNSSRHSVQSFMTRGKYPKAVFEGSCVTPMNHNYLFEEA